jgi:hypothetical protein
MNTPPPIPGEEKKKGMSCLAIGGIGCLVIVILLFVGGGAMIVKFFPAIKDFVAEAQANPDKAAAKLSLKIIPGVTIIREDDANQEIVFKVADGEELTMNYKDIQKTRQPTIKNSKGEVINLESLGKAAGGGEGTGVAPPEAAPTGTLPAPQR